MNSILTNKQFDELSAAINMFVDDPQLLVACIGNPLWQQAFNSRPLDEQSFFFSSMLRFHGTCYVVARSLFFCRWCIDTNPRPIKTLYATFKEIATMKKNPTDNHSLWVARLQDSEGAVYSYIFRAQDDEATNESRDYADQMQMSLVEVMPADEFVQNFVYELTTP